MSSRSRGRGPRVSRRAAGTRDAFSSLLACSLALLLPTVAVAAEITANKMAILNTEQGRVTVFEDGVSIVDGETRISASRVEFHDAENRAVISGGVSIVMPRFAGDRGFSHLPAGQEDLPVPKRDGESGGACHQWPVAGAGQRLGPGAGRDRSARYGCRARHRNLGRGRARST